LAGKEAAAGGAGIGEDVGKRGRLVVSIITLTTDFGLADHYVGAMKGVILSLAPAATIVDITHYIAPQDLFHGAVILANTVDYFPSGSIHVVVVDPGVGGGRRVLLIECRDQLILVPDNGVATLVLEACPPRRVTAVTETRFFRSPVSRTFHGRDIFAPVAAHLATGVAPAAFGPAMDDPVRLDWPRPRVRPDCVEGEVLYADHFGNLVTNIDASAAVSLGEAIRVRIAERTCPFVGTYADAPAEALVALVGSSDLIEVSQVNGSALKALGAGPGTLVTLVPTGG